MGLNPKRNDPATSMQQAAAAVATGDFVKAEKIYRRLVTDHALYPAARRELGVAQYLRGNAEAAVGLLLDAYLRMPDDPRTLEFLAIASGEAGLPEFGLRIAEAAMAANPDSFIALKARIKALSAMGYLAEARQVAGAMGAQGRRDPELGYVQAGTHIATEDWETAKPAILDSYRHGLRSLEIFKRMANFGASCLPEDFLAELRKIEATHTSADDRLAFAHIRAKLAIGRGEYDEALRILSPHKEKSLARNIGEVKSTRARCDKNFQRLKGAGKRSLIKAPDPSFPASLLLLGASRSGKSTLERRLACHQNVVPGFENRLLLYAATRTRYSAGLPRNEDLHELPLGLARSFGGFYQAAVDRLAPAGSVVTTTHPNVISALHAVAGMLPLVYAVLIYRDPRDLAYRQYFQDYNKGNFYASTLAGAEQYNEWYHRTMDRLAELLPDTSVKVSYDELVTEPETVVTRIGKLVDLGPRTKPYPTIPDDRGFAENFSKV